MKIRRLSDLGCFIVSVFVCCQVSAEYSRLPENSDLGETYISGFNFYNKKVTYEKIDGYAILEGDIILGTVEEAEIWREIHEGGEGTTGPQSVVITGERFRWPNNVLPYQISNNVSDIVRERIEDAIEHWEANTPIRFVERTANNAGDFPDFVEVVSDADQCSSFVGRRGGRQTLNVFERCGFGSVVHEFGHALGFWHEQSREDRDNFVEINWENIIDGREHNFNQHIADGDDIGAYDYGSIMHYGEWAFSNGDGPTIVPLEPGAEIGQRRGLSDGDIAAIDELYPEFMPVAQVAKNRYSVFLGNEIFLDGRPSFSPSDLELTFSWDLDDGTSASNVSRLVHTYMERGKFTPTLTVVDTDGNRDSDQATVFVYGAEVLVPIINNIL